MKDLLKNLDQAWMEIERLEVEIKKQEHWLLNHSGCNTEMMEDVADSINKQRGELNEQCYLVSSYVEQIQDKILKRFIELS